MSLDPKVMQLKSSTSDVDVQTLRFIEHKADQCFENLRLYSYPKGLASWATLVHLTAVTEHHRGTQGVKDYSTALINGRPVAKLSDNIAKASGDPNEIERMKRLTGYVANFSEACRY